MGAESSKFEGKWFLERGENYEEYLIDLGISSEMRAVYTANPPYLHIEIQDGVHVVVRSWKKGTPPKQLDFTIGTPFLYRYM